MIPCASLWLCQGLGAAPMLGTHTLQIPFPDLKLRIFLILKCKNLIHVTSEENTYIQLGFRSHNLSASRHTSTFLLSSMLM